MVIVFCKPKDRKEWNTIKKIDGTIICLNRLLNKIEEKINKIIIGSTQKLYKRIPNFINFLKCVKNIEPRGFGYFKNILYLPWTKNKRHNKCLQHISSQIGRWWNRLPFNLLETTRHRNKNRHFFVNCPHFRFQRLNSEKSDHVKWVTRRASIN